MYIVNAKVVLRRYLKDNRSIPVSGSESEGTDVVPTAAMFQVKEGNVSYTDTAGTATTIGTTCQYQVLND